jgi:hypothetical protein
MGGFAASRILEVHGERMIKRTFDPGFRIGLHQKDLNLALSAARSLGVALPNTATAQELFRRARGDPVGIAARRRHACATARHGEHEQACRHGRHSAKGASGIHRAAFGRIVEGKS